VQVELNKNGLFEDTKGVIYEPEVRMSDSIPPSLSKGESTGIDDDNIVNNTQNKDLIFEQHKSIPLTDNNRIQNENINEDHKSDFDNYDDPDIEIVGGSKKTNGKKKVIKGKKKDANESKHLS